MRPRFRFDRVPVMYRSSAVLWPALGWCLLTAGAAESAMAEPGPSPRATPEAGTARADVEMNSRETRAAGSASRTVFRHVTTHENLSSDAVNSIYQDSQGFLRIGTADGLNRYDGSSVLVYRHDPIDPSSIGGNYINAVVEDSYLIRLTTSQATVSERIVHIR